MNIINITSGQQLIVNVSAGSADVTAHFATQASNGLLTPGNHGGTASSGTQVAVQGVNDGIRMVKELTICAKVNSTAGKLQIQIGGVTYDIASFSLNSGESWNFDK